MSCCSFGVFRPPPLFCLCGCWGQQSRHSCNQILRGGTSTQECELDQSTKETTRGAGEEEKQRQEAQQGRQATRETPRPTRAQRGTQNNRDNEPAAPKKPLRHKHHRATQAKQPQDRQAEREQHRHSRREAHCAGPERRNDRDVNLVGCSFILLGDYDGVNSEAHY